ncbi:MAG: glycosyltransferase family protein [Sulfuricaulis sp.]
MTDWKLNTPVAFIIFNRPDTTERVFAEIAKARPPKLLVIADGTRPDRPAESEKCAAARAVIRQVNWDCEVLTNYSDVNLGLKRRVSSGMSWVFEHVDEAIILEDDCLPHPSFFRYCEEMLSKYRDDRRVMAISGDNFQFGKYQPPYSYYFSRYNHIWGWATWRRAWRYYDVEMKSWPEMKRTGWLDGLINEAKVARYWSKIFESVYTGEINTWDYQWTFACWMQNGLTTLPGVNLISNIGFGAAATHTMDSLSRFSNMAIQHLDFPLRHPPDVVRDPVADAITEKTMCLTPLSVKVIYKAKSVLSRLKVKLGMVG